MDEETLNWIKSKDPFGAIVGGVSLLPEDLETLKAFVPKDEWFFEKALVDSIHGLRHMLRVGCYSIVESRSNGVGEKEMLNSLTAAVLHDIRRENDNGDPGHGARAAEWFSANAGTVGEAFGVFYDVSDIEQVCEAIREHESGRPLSDCTNVDSVTNLRIADGADRYRLPKPKWWFDPSKSDVNIGRDLLSFAHRLVVNSESERLSGIIGAEAVLSVLKRNN